MNTHGEIKSWEELTSDELSQLNKNQEREWGIRVMGEVEHTPRIFFLLKNNNERILAQGQLVPVKGIKFNNEEFNIMGIGGIIASEKGKGYGKQIMHEIENYLISLHKTGIGFTNVPDFYAKCGFMIDSTTIKRFIHINEDKKIINIDDKYVIYKDSEDKFMQKVLSNTSLDIYLPRNPDW